MDELRGKFEKFCASKPKLGSLHMRELLYEIFFAADAIRTLPGSGDRARIIRTLAAVEDIRDAFHREDHDALSKNVMLYGVWAL